MRHHEVARTPHTSARRRPSVPEPAADDIIWRESVEPAPAGRPNVTQRAADSSERPAERVRDAVQESETALGEDLLDRVKSQPPEFLERLVLDLLTAMGYGGREGAAQHLGRSGDDGIDGVIRQDALALDRVYVQAKAALHDRGCSRGLKPPVSIRHLAM